MPKPMRRHLEMLELQKAMYDPTIYQVCVCVCVASKWGSK